MSMLLAGDIGGTKTILRLVSSEEVNKGKNLPQQSNLSEKSYLSQEYNDLVPIVEHFLPSVEQYKPIVEHYKIIVYQCTPSVEQCIYVV